MIKDIIKLWNDNFHKGVTVFQMFLMVFMVLGVIIDNYFLTIFSMIICLFAYFEPTDDRFCLGRQPQRRKV